MEYVYIECQYGGYYEPSISITVSDRNNLKGYESEMFLIESKEDFVKAFEFIYGGNEFGDAMDDISLKNYNNIVRNFKQVFSEHFKTEIIANLKTLRRVVDNSYSYSVNHKLNMALFGSHSDYGSFGQQILPFNDWLSLLKKNNDFEKWLISKLPKLLQKLVYVGNEEARIVDIESSINRLDEQIEHYQKNIKDFRKSKNKLKKELKEIFPDKRELL